MTKMISDMKKLYKSINYLNILSSLVFVRGHNQALHGPFPAGLYLGATLILVVLLVPVSVQAETPPVAGTKTKEAVKSTGNSDKVAVPSGAGAAEVPTAPYAGLSQRSVSTSEWVVKAEQWELVRDGESVLALPALNTLVNNWLKEKDKLIEVQYPGGEEGEFWVHQFIDWLVALGIPSDRIVTVRGSGADDIIRLNLIK
jgi:hypothetical protein